MFPGGVTALGKGIGCGIKQTVMMHTTLLLIFGPTDCNLEHDSGVLARFDQTKAFWEPWTAAII
jgi:hypothetical protein